MNYYPFHLGDYASHTGHLEPMEDLAYRRMLDAYYLRETPLPPSVPEVARLIRMRQNVTEVEAVLNEFFLLTSEGWRHSRCDEEIAKMQDKQAASSEKVTHERDRMRRHRERRSEMFDALRNVGITPAWDICKRPPNALLARGWIQVQAVVGAAGCQRWGSREEMSACLVVGRRVMTSRRYA